MTKQKISITLDEEMIKIIENILKDAQFRNRSHVIEYSLKKFLQETLNKAEGEHFELSNQNNNLKLKVQGEK